MNFLKMYFMGIIDSNIQDGGGRHLEKSKNRNISAAV